MTNKNKAEADSSAALWNDELEQTMASHPFRKERGMDGAPKTVSGGGGEGFGEAAVGGCEAGFCGGAG